MDTRRKRKASGRAARGPDPTDSASAEQIKQLRKLASHRERLRKGLLEWASELELQVAYVAAQLEEGGALDGIVPPDDVRNAVRHLHTAADGLADAQRSVTQLVVPLFLIDEKGGA
ncbi:MAG: hypothetical protein J0I06_07835 [Planctomycetes bacterium]|nr:hypothetical protein [Planctomycetota bacterium]